jgi:hypothetical protein
VRPGQEAKLRAAYGALEGVIVTAEDLLGRSTALAPLDEGTLRGSGAVVLIVNGQRFEGSGARDAARAAIRSAVERGGGIVIFGEVSFNTVYAARQHEETTWHHVEGQAKYLEAPLLEQGNRYERVIALSSERGSD